MNEIQNILEPKEKLVYDCKPEYAPYIIGAILVSLFVGAILGTVIGVFQESFVLGIVIGTIIFIVLVVLSNIAYTRIHYAITNKRVIIQRGIIGRDFRSIDYDRMQNVSVDVGVLGVIFKVGSIRIFTGEIETVGSNKYPKVQSKYDRFDYITSPYDVLKKLQAHLSKRKEKLA